MQYQTNPARKCSRSNTPARLTLTLPFHYHPIWWAHFHANTVIPSQGWRLTRILSLKHRPPPSTTSCLGNRLMLQLIMSVRGGKLEVQKLSIVFISTKDERELPAIKSSTVVNADSGLCVCVRGKRRDIHFANTAKTKEEEEINKEEICQVMCGSRWGSETFLHFYWPDL